MHTCASLSKSSPMRPSAASNSWAFCFSFAISLRFLPSRLAAGLTALRSRSRSEYSKYSPYCGSRSAWPRSGGRRPASSYKLSIAEATSSALGRALKPHGAGEQALAGDSAVPQGAMRPEAGLHSPSHWRLLWFFHSSTLQHGTWALWNQEP